MTSAAGLGPACCSRLATAAFVYGVLVVTLHITGVPDWVPGWVPLWR